MNMEDTSLLPPDYFSQLVLASAKASDGKNVLIARTIIHKRIVDVEYQDDDAIEKPIIRHREIHITYSILAPYRVQHEGGERVELRIEKRTRVLGHKDLDVVSRTKPETIELAIGNLEYFDVLDNPLPIAIVRTTLADWSPVVILQDDNPPEPFYQQLLHPATILVRDRQGLLPKLIGAEIHVTQ
jgi:hypothetical protein